MIVTLSFEINTTLGEVKGWKREERTKEFGREDASGEAGHEAAVHTAVRLHPDTLQHIQTQTRTRARL